MPEPKPYQPRWHTDPRTCSHSNDDVCEMCDFDLYYALTYPSCPWATTLDTVDKGSGEAFCCLERDQYGECGHVQPPSSKGSP